MRLHLIAAIALFPLAAVAAGDDHDEHSDHLAEMDGLRLLHAWTRAGDGKVADVFVEIENQRDETVVLLGGDTDFAGEARIMAMPLSAGADDPQPVEAMPIAADSTLELTPDGLFLRIDGVTTPRVEGDGFEMHLEFQQLGEIEIHVDVEAADARAHSHAGHAH